LQADVEKSGRPKPATDAATIAALYGIHKNKFGRLLKGTFVAAVLDEESGALLLISDRLGSYPLYWFRTGDRFVFASELRSALRAHPRPALNAAAVADLLKFAFPMGDKTLAAGVDMLPTASTLTYCARTNTVEIEPYASIAELFQPEDLSHDVYLDGVREACAQSMDRAVRGTHRYGSSLSGGLDTRVILSA